LSRKISVRVSELVGRSRPAVVKNNDARADEFCAIALNQYSASKLFAESGFVYSCVSLAREILSLWQSCSAGMRREGSQRTLPGCHSY
jgi:hypothetical protein